MKKGQLGERKPVLAEIFFNSDEVNVALVSVIDTI